MLEWKIAAIFSFASWYWLPHFETSFDLLKRGYVRHLSGQFVMSQVVRGLPMALAATSLQFLLLKAPTKGVIYFRNGRGGQVIASSVQQMLGHLQSRPWVFSIPHATGENTFIKLIFLTHLHQMFASWYSKTPCHWLTGDWWLSLNGFSCEFLNLRNVYLDFAPTNRWPLKGMYIWSRRSPSTRNFGTSMTDASLQNTSVFVKL